MVENRKKYKLIQRYPNSPRLGEIAEYSNGYYMVYQTKPDRVFELSKNAVENNPKFWGEILETSLVFHIGKSLTEPHPGGKTPYYIYQDKESYCKKKGIKYFYCKKDCKKWADEQVEELGTLDYEILQIKNSFGNFYPLLKGEKLGRYELEHHKIYSIKRLSDGEVFTIGDTIIFEKFNSKSIIVSFKIYNNRIKVNTEGINFITGTYFLESIKKVKKPLFTTEDGVDIFEDKQKVFSVSECDFLLQNHQDFAWIKTRDKDRKYHHFSTKEAAEEYILYNKPINLSLNDLYKIKNEEGFFGDSLLQKINEIIK